MIALQLALLLLTVHFVADFLFQSDWMAVNKSSRMLPLLVHIAVYTACLIPFGFWFAMTNGLAHLITDSITSRVTSALWKKEKRHWFFVVIGLDQLIHTATLLFTASRLL